MVVRLSAARPSRTRIVARSHHRTSPKPAPRHPTCRSGCGNSADSGSGSGLGRSGPDRLGRACVVIGDGDIQRRAAGQVQQADEVRAGEDEEEAHEAKVAEAACRVKAGEAEGPSVASRSSSPPASMSSLATSRCPLAHARWRQDPPLFSVAKTSRGAGGAGRRKVAPRAGARGAAKKSGAHF